MSHFVDGLKKYVDFGGRASRTQYWMFMLVSFVISIVLLIVDNALGTAPDVETGVGTGLLGAIFSLAIFLPSLAILVRRFHDSGKSGWWALILLVPCVGLIVWLVFALQKSDGPNQWGPAPA